MPSIEWSHELSMGVPLIDEQHKQLIALANNLIEAVDRGQKRQAIEDALRRLREYTVFHFNSEEQLMKEVLYDKRGDHALEHRRLKEQVKHYRRSIYYKENLNPEAVLTFLQSWLIKHLLETDRLLANFIHARKNKGNGEAAPGGGPAAGLPEGRD